MTTELGGSRIPFSPNDYPSDHVPQPRMYNHSQQVPTSATSTTRTFSFPLNDAMVSPPPSFAESTSDQFSVPSELPKYGSLPPEELALTSNCVFSPQVFVSGGSRSPDLTAASGQGQKLYHFETASTWVYHETYVKDLYNPRSLFIIRRNPVQAMPEGTWRYTIHLHGGTSVGKEKTGTKILEIDTDPGMLSGGRNKSWETRLIFRNAKTSELDGLTLRVTQEGLGGKGMGGEVLYKGKKVADITDQRKKDPGFELRIFRQGLDPLLVVLMAYVMDDRVMGSKRRNRRSRASGVPGIGKGPGAGLAGAYALGGLI